MFHTLVVTGGISIFAPRNLGRRWAERRARELLSFPERSSLALQPGITETEVIEHWHQHRPSVEDPRTVSAEYSAIHALPLADRARVLLLHSDTVAGRLAATMVADLAKANTSVQVSCQQIADLDVDRPDGVRRALADFVHKLAHALAQGEPRTTAFAPIGGYKVMTALGYLVGAYRGYPSVYLHETRQLVHRVPPVRIQVDEEDLSAVADLVRRTWRSGAEIDDPEELRAVDARPWLFERADQIVYLNAFGELLRTEERYASVLRTRVRVASGIELRGREDLFRREVRGLLEKLERPVDHRGELNHAPSFGHHRTAFSLYKGTSKQQGPFRAAWRYDEAHDVLDLRAVWFDHAVYEREVDRGTILGPHDGPWTDVSDTVWTASGAR